MIKNRKRLAMIMVIMLILVNTTSVFAGESGRENEEIIPASSLSSIVITVNGRQYSATQTFLFSSIGINYKAGISSNTNANTVRSMYLNVTFDTVHEGYITKSGGGSTSGTNEKRIPDLVYLNQALRSNLYTSYSGSCSYYYGGSLLGTGYISYP